MSGRVRPVATGLPGGAISSTRSTPLTEGWELTSTPPGAWTSAPRSADADWLPAIVPGTVACCVGQDDLDAHPRYDAVDWWYRCVLPADAFVGGAAAKHRLRFDGLATLAEVWLNGERVLESANMFCAWEVDVSDLVAETNELMICLRALDRALGERRPRPRWKTRLVESQQLRWFRTTLLGRIPGWTPAIQPVGPWRTVWGESVPALDVRSIDLRCSVDGHDGVVDFAATFAPVTDAVTVAAATLHVDGSATELALERTEGGSAARGRARIEQPQLWWPHTHGQPALHLCSLALETSAGPVSVDCGRIGFRNVAVERDGGRIQLVVNGVPVFSRGSCWTTNDVVSLVGDPAGMRRSLELLAAAHGNMVRVGGTMVYETDAFYRACDELGILVWQDFMFANMDYPVGDEAFAESVRTEARQQLRRLSRHPSVVTFCGGSEVEQQAAMFGAPREIWSNTLFAETLPALVESEAPGIPYWPSTPTGGALPFQLAEGLSHYYGLGAYRRPLDDVRLAGVKFTPECLGFSHVPERENLQRLTRTGAVPPHDPAWKRGVPRDTGPGWDFEDVRDHYLERLYGVHAVELRSTDPERYLALSRIVTGEVIEHAFAEWRRSSDPCGGALTWFWRDLRPGAGWGVLDSDGVPKAAYHHLQRVWAPRCVRLLDRGLDGLRALVLNETGSSLACRLELLLIAHGCTIVSEATVPVHVAARSSAEISVEETFGYFIDSTYSYRFGPPRHEAVVARLIDAHEDVVLSEDVYRPVRSAMTPATGLDATVERGADGCLLVRLVSDALLYDVRLELRDHRPLENHFCLTPGRPRSVTLVGEGSRAPLVGYVEALNLQEAVRLEGPA